MSFIRARALRSAQNAFARASPRAASPRTQLVAKRFASSGHGEHAPSSDLPWLITALVVTPVSCWYLWPDSSHADSSHHGHDAHAEHEEPQEEEKEEEKEEPASEEPAEEKKGEEEDSAEETKEQPGEKADEGENTESADNDSDKSETNGSTKRPVSSTKAKIHPDSDGAFVTRKIEPGNKGGNKIRLDSGLGKNLGEGMTSDTAYNDSPGAPSTSTITKKQAGLSNTDTRHSTRPDAPGSEISTKGHGGPETAKHKGTVDPNAPVK